MRFFYWLQVVIALDGDYLVLSVQLTKQRKNKIGEPSAALDAAPPRWRACRYALVLKESQWIFPFDGVNKAIWTNKNQ